MRFDDSEIPWSKPDMNTPARSGMSIGYLRGIRINGVDHHKVVVSSDINHEFTETELRVLAALESKAEFHWAMTEPRSTNTVIRRAVRTAFNTTLPGRSESAANLLLMSRPFYMEVKNGHRPMDYALQLQAYAATLGITRRLQQHR